MVSSETEIPNSACNCMIRSHARHRTTPCTAGIGPSSTSRARNTLCSSPSLGGAPGEGMLVRPSGPCSLNRITQSRNVWRSIPPISAASSREAPSRTAAIASSRRACAASFARLANRRTSPAVKSVRTATAWPMANDPPFASLNHFAADSGIPTRVRHTAAWYYADRNGRKGAMLITVIGVGVVTTAFGLLPTAEMVGVAAPILFLILRLVQGVFVGGVVASTHTVATETIPARWRGTVSGFIGGGGAGIGALIASIVYYITSSVFPGPAFAAWGWRFMFFAGILSSVLGFFIFNALEESPLWQQLDRSKVSKQAPLRTLFSQRHLNAFLVNLLITVGGGVGYYLTSGYMPTFLRVVLKIPTSVTSALLIAGSLVTIVAAISAGALSDWIG